MRDIKQYEGLYAVTEDGRVWSYKNNKYLRPSIDSEGYLKVNLYRNGKRKTHTIHRLVAIAYIPNPHSLPQVGHLDEVRTHSSVDNLCWCAASENINYGTRNLKVAKKMSKPVYCVELKRAFDSGKQAAEELSIDRSRITKCCKNKVKTVCGYHFTYLHGGDY